MRDVLTIGSAARSVLIRVADLDQAKSFYADCLHLTLIAETDAVSESARALWAMPEGRVRCARLAKPGDEYGMIDLIEWSGGVDEPFRTADAAFDYGWLTLNYKTSDLRRALGLLSECGARLVSDPHAYQAGGKMITEAMVELVTGERCTILQVGDAITVGHPFGEAVATAGAVVPSVGAALPFYRDVLGLNVAITIHHQGEPFSTLLGAPPETELDMALLAAPQTWTGKLELLQLTLPKDAPMVADANARAAAGRRTGYWMVGLITIDIAAFADKVESFGGRVIRPPMDVAHPLSGSVRAMIVAAPGGERFEVMQASSVER